ncbi:MAG TPA: hypothetical protein VGF38_24185 [Ktedonobacterales bacterium]
MTEQQDEQEELDRKAADLRVMGYNIIQIAHELGITTRQAGSAVVRGMALKAVERPAKSLEMYHQMRIALLEWQAKDAAGDKHAKRVLQKLRKVYVNQVAITRHENPGWEPEPLPSETTAQ